MYTVFYYDYSVDFSSIELRSCRFESFVCAVKFKKNIEQNGLIDCVLKRI